ncbi:MAG: Gfo/Idh/MocA family oxidoreductase [Acidimicrobiales bacterium]
MAEALRWGVLGASSRMYRTRILGPMQASDRHVVVAEASRDASGSEQPYADLLARPDVDAVYVPLPNLGHKPWVLAALEAGKHVLCEKPLTMSAADTDEVYEAAASAGRALVEAYMWPHHPRHQALLDVARDGLGDLRFARAAFTFPLRRPDDHRFDARGRGALFDVGIYCLGPSVLMAPREPVAVAASAVRNEHGVDVSMSAWVDLGEGFATSIEVSFETVNGRSFQLTGTGGRISIPDWFAPGPEEPSTLEVLRLDDSVERIECAGANAYGQMLDQFADVVQHAAHPVWGPAESRRLARWIDAVQAAAA